VKKLTCRVILGRAGSGKTYLCLDEISRLAAESPQGPPIIFIVPEQATFIHEKMLATNHGLKGYSRVQVIGFRRLIRNAHSALNKPLLPPLSEAGKRLLMSKLLTENREQLQVFTSAQLQSGFAELLVATADEIAVWGIDQQQLQYAATQIAVDHCQSHLGKKLTDISLLTGLYNQFIADRYENFPDGMDFLVTAIREHGYLSDAIIYIDGYSEFTPKELAVISALFVNAAAVNIALPLDPRLKDSTIGETDPFYSAWRCYRLLLAIIRSEKLSIIETLLADSNYRFAVTRELGFLEQHLFPFNDTAEFNGDCQHIYINCAVNPRLELHSVARHIRRLVRDKSLRYREIGIVSRDITPYAQLLRTVFDEYQIPFFVDSKKTVFTHPLIEMIRAALECWVYRPRHATIFRYLKTGLTPLSIQELDQLENYCLANGINHWDWFDDKNWTKWRSNGRDKNYFDSQLEQINGWRRRGSAALLQFITALSDNAAVADVCSALKQLMTQLNVEQTLDQWQRQEQVKSQGFDAAIDRQIYQLVVSFLNEAQLLLADTILLPEHLLNTFDNGISGLTLSLTPPGLDEVFISSLERSRNPALKVAFVIGVNEGALPRKITDNAIFSDRERRQLLACGIELAAGSTSRQLAENYLVYVALTRASQELYLSYPLADEQGGVLLPSPVIRRLKTIFPALNIQASETESIWELGNSQHALSSLAFQLRKAEAGNPIDNYWWDVYNWYLHNEQTKPLLKQMLQGLFYRRDQQRLSTENIVRLYGHTLRSSVSRIEKFRACPFSYFAGYGLKLKPRPVYQITALDRGSLFHEVLAQIGRTINQRQLAWENIDDAAATQLIEESMTMLLPRFLGNILCSSARYQYLTSRIKSTLKAAVLMMAEHMRRGYFVPVAWELPFGQNSPDSLPALTIELENGNKLEINGVIDRIDMAKDDKGHSWFRIIDYKTGQVSLSINEIIEGLRLQLIVYLQVVLTNSIYFEDAGENAHAAGIYYTPVRDTFIEYTPGDDEDQPIIGNIRLNGISVLDETAVHLADPAISGHSRLIPAAYGKKGFWDSSPGISEQQMDELRQQLLIMLKSSAAEMISGLIEASPVKRRNFDACSYCDFKTICGFEREFAVCKGEPYDG